MADDYPWYYAVSSRPVLVTKEGGSLKVQVFNWTTGEFDENVAYLEKVFAPGEDVDKFSESEFNAYVAKLRQDIATKRR